MGVAEVSVGGDGQPLRACFAGGETKLVRTGPGRILRVVDDGEPKEEARKLVGVRGQWYDVTSFIAHHPGGDVIEEFIGKDATAQVLAFHGSDVLKGRRPVGTYEREVAPVENDFESLLLKYRDEGWYDPPIAWFIGKCIVVAAFLAVAAYSLWTPCPAWIAPWLWQYVIPGISLGLFWQQSAFMAHDLMHNSTFQQRKRDQAWGWFFGNVCFGVSSLWWRDEHFEHHAFTNTIVPGVGSGDPQQHEKGLWAQDPMLLPLASDKLSLAVVKLQGITFLPLSVLAGRIGICTASLASETNLNQQVGIALHWGLVVALLSGCDGWLAAAGVWYIAAVASGVLAVQLCVSHYDKPFMEKEQCKAEGWFVRQVSSTKDISNPWWVDWFHGGLNYHTVHHTMPRLPRARFRQAQADLYAICDKHGVPYDSRSFFEGVMDIVQHMHKESQFATWREIFLGQVIL